MNEYDELRRVDRQFENRETPWRFRNTRIGPQSGGGAGGVPYAFVDWSCVAECEMTQTSIVPMRSIELTFRSTSDGDDMQDRDALLQLLKECQPFLFDDSGTPIAPEDLRERVNDALHPATPKQFTPRVIDGGRPGDRGQ